MKPATVEKCREWLGLREAPNHKMVTMEVDAAHRWRSMHYTCIIYTGLARKQTVGSVVQIAPPRPATLGLHSG